MSLKVGSSDSVLPQNVSQVSKPALDKTSQAIQQVANKDLASSQRLNNSFDSTARDIGKVLNDVGKLLESIGNLMQDAQKLSTPTDMAKMLNDAGDMFINASNLMNDITKLTNNKPALKDASQSFQDGQKQLRDAGQALNNANGSTPESALSKASDSARAAGQSIDKGVRETERGTMSASNSGVPRITGQMMREQILKGLQNRGMQGGLPSIQKTSDSSDRPISIRPANKPASSPVEDSPVSTPQIPIFSPDGKLSPELKELVKQKVNNYIEKTVNSTLFDKDKLGLQQNYSGSFSRSGQTSKTFGNGVSVDDVKNYVNSNGVTAYGAEGKTLTEGSFSKTVGQIDKTAQGKFGTAYVTGNTNIGARGRVFGDISLKDKTAYIGAEGEVGARATYNAGYSSPSVRIAGQEVALNAGVGADVFVGASGKGKLEVSLKGNEPHVAVGGEVFAGARATVQGSAGATINGQQVAEVHGKAEGWAGVGAKAGVDVGFKNGKLNFDADFGVALGIGGAVDLGFSVDVGAIGKGIVNGIEHVADNAVDNIEELGKDLGKTAAKVGHEIEHTVEVAAHDIGQTVSHAAQEVGHTIEHAAQDAGKAIGHAAQDAGKAIGSFFKKIF